MVWVSSGREMVGPKVIPRAASGMSYPITARRPKSNPPMIKNNQKDREICLEVKKANPMKAG
jgi:hypothetical protein